MKIFFLIISILLLNLNNLNAKDNPQKKGKDPPPVSIRIFHKQNTVIASNGDVAYILFLIIIERHPSNRGFTLSWDCPGIYGSTYKSLEGENGQRIFDSQNLRNLYLTEGLCIIAVDLERNDRRNIRVIETITVLSPEQ